MYCFVRFQKGLRSVFDESSQMAWFFCTTSNIYRYIPTNSHKTLTNYIPVFSGRITLSIGENHMKIRSVVLEFIANRQTDRRGGGLCFIICIDIWLYIFGLQRPLSLVCGWKGGGRSKVLPSTVRFWRKIWDSGLERGRRWITGLM